MGSLMHHACAKTFNRFHCNSSIGSLFDSSSPLCDLDFFARGWQNSWSTVDQTCLRLVVGELYCRFATRPSLYKCRCTRVLQGCCGLDGSGELPLSRGDFLLDYFRNCAAG